ncbi:tagaturonate reductase [Pedobacter sp. CG_S7]|uniref:tagaturonate reductase n=1 Tax=Pedobacter sp. CG_S7 TaxID=3143930 RepID=UPI003399BC13
MILSKGNLENIKTGKVVIPQKAMFNLPEKVLQFGTGVLLRGLPDFFIDKANKNGVFNGRIVVVKSTSNGGTTDFERQDNLYTLCVRGIANGEAVEENVICSAISRVIAAESNWKSILEFAQNPDLKIIISNTTEVGIVLVKELITQNPPVSFPAKLLAVLFERYQKFENSVEGNLVVIPTELLPDNGKKLEAIIRELAVFNDLEAGFMTWLNKNVEFCNSLVDRIVPGKPDQATLDALEKELGYQDNLLSMVEPYALWAIEGGENVASLLSFNQTDTGVVITNDIERFRELKVRLLNGTHTLSCGIAVLSGIGTVKNGMADEKLQAYIKALMLQEIGPAIPYAIEKTEKLAFTATVLDRFANPYIEHQWINITVQYTMKMKLRILPVLINYYKINRTVPKYIAFGFAAYLLFMNSEEKNGKYYGHFNEQQYLINDDSAAYFNEKLHASVTEKDYLTQVFEDVEFWGLDFKSLPGFTVAVADYYDKIKQTEIKEAFSSFLV